MTTLDMGNLVAKVSKMFKGERHRSKFLKKIAFAGYNKKVGKVRTENDWVSKNPENVDKYNKDKFCTFSFTVNGYQTLFGAFIMMIC